MKETRWNYKTHNNEAPQPDCVVGGIRLRRRFRIRRLGRFGLDVADPEASRSFYERLLGLKISDPIDMGFVLPPKITEEVRCNLGSQVSYFMRVDTDHHALVLFPSRVMRTGRSAPPDFEEVTTNQIIW